MKASDLLIIVRETVRES